MPKILAQSIIAFAVSFATIPPSVSADSPSKLELLQGKWSVTKTNAEGGRYSQSMEFAKDHFAFRRADDDGQVRLFAKGLVRAEKAGPFETLILSNLQAGRSPEELESVNDERTLVYTLREGRLILASNLDKERENEKPSLDSYAHVESPKEAPGSPQTDESKLVGTWKAKITYAENELDYDLRIAKADGKLEATLVSPRSGDHKCKSAAYKEGELVLEIDRDIQGTDVTFVYKAKLTAEGLSGTVEAKGFENQLNGKWKASK